jgi:hypothetical protein
MSCFNVIFTFLPPLAIGIFDQFVSARMLDKYPQLYILGQQNEFFNQKKFWGWFANAIFHSLVCLQFCSHIIPIVCQSDRNFFQDSFLHWCWLLPKRRCIHEWNKWWTMVGWYSCIHRCAWLYFVERCIDYRVSYKFDIKTVRDVY